MAWVTHNPFAAPATLPKTTGPQTVEEQLPRDDCNEVLNFLRDTIEPKSWQREGVYIKIVAGKLVVRQTGDIHRKVAQMVQELGFPVNYAAGTRN